MKNWKTTAAALIGAAVILARAKHWIDDDVAAFIGSAALILFGAAAQDAKKEN